MNLGNAMGPPVVRDVGVLHQPGAGADQAVQQQQQVREEHLCAAEDTGEKVARLHLAKVGVKRTELRPDQADYIGVKPEARTSPATTALIRTCLERPGTDRDLT